MKAGIIVFPGINRERDMAIALERSSAARRAWSGTRETDLAGLDLVVIPGGFSYRRLPALRRDGGAVAGDARGARSRRARRLRAGRLQRLPDPRRSRPAARRAAAQRCLRFLSMDCHLRVERTDTAFTNHYQRGQVFRAVMAHGDGNYFADDATLDRLEGEGLVAFRYATPTGESPRSQPQRQRAQHRRHLQPDLRVLGLMPHPEDLVDPLMGGTDGKPLFDALAAADAA